MLRSGVIRIRLEPRASDLPLVRKVLTINKRVPLHVGHWLGLRHRPRLKITSVEKVFGKLGGNSAYIRTRLKNMGYKDN